MRVRRLLAGGASLVLLVGCNRASDNNQAATAAAIRALPLATFRGPTTHESLDGGRLQFDRPAAWPLHTFDKYADIRSTRQLGTNSNMRVRNPCRRNPDTSEVQCGAPLDEMRASSVYIQWIVLEPKRAKSSAPDSFSVSGSNTEVDGRPATLTARDACGNLHGDRAFSLLVSPSAQRTYWALACIRGPGASNLEANVLATLRSVRTTLPDVTTATTAPKLTTSTTSAVVSAGAKCKSHDLRISVGDVGVALGHWGTRVVFQNTGRAVCELTGYPKVAGLNDHGRAADPARPTPTGYIGWDTSDPPAVLRLEPGGQASAVLEGTNVPEGDATTCPTYDAIRVSPPNDAKSATFDGPWNNCSGMEIHPLVAGATGQESRDSFPSD